MWAVREISPNALAVGFFNQQKVEIYEGDTLKRSLNVGMSIFGFVVPPNLTEATPSGTYYPRRLIAFDNSKYAVIDLEAVDETESTKTLF